MTQIRKSEDRGHANHGWLDSYHTFSFADYYDPKHMGFRSLRVINEDRVAPRRGFGAHGHQNMEILTYVLEGSLAHQDNMGHREVLGPNEIQRMSAGTGVVHSESNASDKDSVHFLQIWIEPATTGNPSSYQQLRFDPREKRGKLKLLAGPQGGDRVASINQDAQLFVAELSKGDEVAHDLGTQRYGWLHLIRGAVTVNGTALHTGDSVAIANEPGLKIIGTDSQPSEVLLFDLA
jgi:redox-sensitive bicupin YhaK (pirin superfamily)